MLSTVDSCFQVAVRWLSDMSITLPCVSFIFMKYSHLDGLHVICREISYMSLLLSLWISNEVIIGQLSGNFLHMANDNICVSDRNLNYS